MFINVLCCFQEHPTLFISGVAGIGKSESAKYFADKNRKKYTNIIYLYYAGNLKKSIAGMEYDDDTSEMTEDMFFYYLPKLVERIEYVMKLDINFAPDKPPPQQSDRSCCDRALLLDYKAELFLIKNDYKNVLKKRLKAVSVLEPYHTEDTDQRTANLLSNLYNNLSNTYLLMKKTKEAAEMLHTALTVRQEYSHLGLTKSHDMLQQLMNLTNILILSKNTDMAKQTLSAYESLVLEHEGTQTLDNGICQMMRGAIALSEGSAKEAELHLLSAENIIIGVMGTDNDYAKTVYLYLNNLYRRWQKPEQALAYKNKYIECSRRY